MSVDDGSTVRGGRVLLVSSAVALLAYALWAIVFCVDDAWRPEWDGALYLLTSETLAAGEGYTYLGEAFFLRPPGFSWLLSLFVEGPFEMDGFGGLNRGLLVAAALAVATLWWCLHDGKHRRLALPAALLTGTAALWVRNFNWVLTEFPFLAALFLAFVALHRGARREERWWIWSLVGAALLAGAFYLRTMAILVLPVLFWLGWTRDQGKQHLRALLPAAVFLVLAAPWLLHSRAAAAEAHVPSDQLLLHDYATATLRVDPGDPSSDRIDFEVLRTRLASNGRGIASDAAHTLLGSRSNAASIAVALAVLLGLGISVRRGIDLFDGLFLAYLALTLAYFTYEERLLVPLLPHLYLYSLTLLYGLGAGVLRLLRRAPADEGDAAPRTAWIPFALPAIAAVVFAVVSVRAFDTATNARDWDVGGVTLGQTWDDLVTVAEWVREETPEDATILCSRAPMIGLLSGRRCYTYRFIRGEDFFQRYPANFAVFDSGAPPQLRQYLRSRAVDRKILESAIPNNAIEILRLR